MSSKVTPYFHPVWIINSTAILFFSFIFTGLLCDIVFAGVASYLDVYDGTFLFDNVKLKEGGEFYSREKVLVLFFSVFAFLGFWMLLNNILYSLTRTRKSLWKLFFQWNFMVSFALFLGYIAMASLGEKSVTRNVLDRKFNILWEYLYLDIEFLPLLTAGCIGFFSLFGSFFYGRYLNMAPSSKYTKDKLYRMLFVLNTVVIPFAIFTMVGHFIYREMPTESRYMVMMIFWFPALIMLYRAYQIPFANDRILAVQDSWINIPDLLFMILSIIGILTVRLFF